MFFKEHFEGSWSIITLLLCLGHFAIPFVGFMSRHVKRNLTLHFIMGLWLIFMHYVDVYWIIMPTLHKSGFTYSLLDVTFMLACPLSRI